MDTFCPSTILGGNVTETERETDRQTERERETDEQIDYHKGFRALGGTLPTENFCAWALGGCVSLRFTVFDSNCFEVSICFAAFDSNFFEGCSCKN